ncbi:uncharacterized protein EKO05_0010191 [Ascochyta rabiei]|uniref:uncharacterized protein n=1 Tax=Didymella rabiei TaxID=5454 RepID=UPI0021FA272D|nr:uncharacterized protein EKO05_0010191 [Ascochyta rabiei]UPX19942.1 hypothetical protein EKO05_0010191 [Ascochyta rabiei]
MSLNISTTAAIRRRFDTGSTHLAFRSSIRPSATQMPSPLLELPSELRNMIWEYALTNDTRSLRYNPDTKRFDVSQIGAGLLVTCRSISLETLHTPICLNTLFFNVGTIGDVDMWLLLAKLERLEQATQCSLRLPPTPQKLAEAPSTTPEFVTLSR